MNYQRQEIHPYIFVLCSFKRFGDQYLLFRDEHFTAAFCN